MLNKTLKFIGVLLIAITLSVFTDISAAKADIIQPLTHAGQPWPGGGIGQSFTAVDENIDTISMWVGDTNVFNAPTFTLTLSLLMGPDFNGVELVSVTNLLPTGMPGGWWDFNIGNVELVPSDIYTFVVAPVGGNRGFFYRAVTNPYSGGYAQYIGGPLFLDDLTFRVLATTPIIEPSTIGLFGLAMIGFRLVSRRRKLGLI